MRIKTSNARREVDRWKGAVSQRYKRFVTSLYFLLITVAYGRQLLLPAFITVVLSLRFAVLEFASLIVLGALLLRLQSYRFANVVLGAFSRRAS